MGFLYLTNKYSYDIVDLYRLVRKGNFNENKKSQKNEIYFNNVIACFSVTY
jgi:hypothetical protein